MKFEIFYVEKHSFYLSLLRFTAPLPGIEDMPNQGRGRWQRAIRQLLFQARCFAVASTFLLWRAAAGGSLGQHAEGTNLFPQINNYMYVSQNS
ncbi:MAG: hypothetical protein K2O78_09930 [Muribaculaceae bacterium]|nr:hypothetical protein [Muribaculaceae bacterium]